MVPSRFWWREDGTRWLAVATTMGSTSVKMYPFPPNWQSCCYQTVLFPEQSRFGKPHTDDGEKWRNEPLQHIIWKRQREALPFGNQGREKPLPLITQNSNCCKLQRWKVELHFLCRGQQVQLKNSSSELIHSNRFCNNPIHLVSLWR